MDLCVVMIYCQGGDLTSFIKNSAAKNAKLTEADIKHHFVQMALALHFMHEKNILHRDLKTGNIFRSSGNILQLGDFGISKVLNGASDLASTCIGTPYYMSPELFKNAKYNNKSDVWALGCILYELTSLKHAFDASNINGLANKVIHGVYPPIATSYSKDLRELIKAMLGVTPSSRPSMKQILLMPTLLKAIKKYVKQVVNSSAAEDASEENTSSSSSSAANGASPISSPTTAIGHRPAHVLNLKNQLERIGPPLSLLFAEVERERQERKAQGGGSVVEKDTPLPSHASRKPRRPAPIESAELYDDDPSSSPAIDRTLIAPSGHHRAGSGNAAAGGDQHHPPTVRRRPAGSKASDKPSSSKPLSKEQDASQRRHAARVAALEKEHAARVAELQAEEAAKAKLEKDFARLQALQAQRAKRLAQRKSQLSVGGDHLGGASTASTSKDSSVGSGHGGSSPGGSTGSSGSAALPIIQPSSSASASPSLHPSASPVSPGLDRTTLPMLNNINAPASAHSSRNASPSMHPRRIGPGQQSQQPAGSSAAAPQPREKVPSFTLMPRAPSPSSFLPSVVHSPSPNPSGSPVGSPNPTAPTIPVAAPSPRTSGIPRRVVPSAVHASAAPKERDEVLSPGIRSDEAKDSAHSHSLSPGTPPPGVSPPPPDSLKLLKRKVHVSRQAENGGGSGASTGSAAPSPEVGPFGANRGGVSQVSPPPSHTAFTTTAGGEKKRGRPRTNKAFPPMASPPPPPESTDVEATLAHEKEELERLRLERLRLEELLTRMDEEHGLFANGTDTPLAAASPRNAPVQSRSKPQVSAPDELSPRSNPTTHQPAPAPKTFSSTVLPAAFDAPLIYKRSTLGAQPTGALGGVSPPAPNNVSAQQQAKSSLVRRHSTHSDAPVVPRPGRNAAAVAAQNPPIPQPQQPSTRDRILAAKASKKSEEANVEQARLLQARKEYFNDRIKAEQRTRDFYGAGGNSSYSQEDSSPSPPMKSSPQAQSYSGPSASPPLHPSSHTNNSDLRRHVSEPLQSPTGSEEAFLIYDDSVLMEHLNSDLLPVPSHSSNHHSNNTSHAAHLLQVEEDELSASSLEVEEFQAHLRQYTRRIENLRSVIEVSSKRPTVYRESDDADSSPDGYHSGENSDGDDYDDDDPVDRSPSPDEPQQQFVPTNLAERKKQLAQECVNLVGREKFVLAYDFLAAVQAEPSAWDDDIDDTRKLEKLTKLMGSDRVKHWKLIDQLLFVESC